ncbi:MAG: T9SS type A sorting domain-containing protein [Ignavibacteriales bacterium]|nr:T9SS type A sorting domain-containing protein [Ignavibacteriales bacterium]MCF8314992.1 T9SS type A sorting domain-containing protein [Ignavibacteriales bacterium]MCF8436058.1 T9SS type A sorting domain-containing protein [Ignavibacteriales bacterium]
MKKTKTYKLWGAVKGTAVAVALGYFLVMPKDLKGQVAPFTLDPFSQPDIQITEGRLPTDYYGSGDADSSGFVDFEDYNAMVGGIQNDRADVDGDGVPSTQNDQNILWEYVFGNRDGLPSHWNHLNGIEKRDWAKKMIEIDQTDTNPYISGEYDCGWFAKEFFVNSHGAENVENYLHYGKFVNPRNARFNIPVQRGFTKITSGVPGSDPPGHRINAVLVGPNDTTKYQADPTNFDHWYFFEPQTDEEVHPGDFSMNANEDVKIKWWGYANGFFTDIILIDFSLEDGQVSGINAVEPYMLTEDPNSPTSVVEENSLEKSVKNFEVGNPYPNPGNGFVNIPYKNNRFGKVTFEIYDMQGQLVDRINKNDIGPGENNFKYDFGKFASGIYTVVGTAIDGSIGAVRVIHLK